MTNDTQAKRAGRILIDRAIFCALGAAAGLALYVLSEFWFDPGLAPLAFLALFSFVGIYCVVMLGIIGPVRPVAAVFGSLLIAGPASVLICLASGRYEIATDVLQDGGTVGISFLMVFLATPFLTLWLRDRSRWCDYALLFETSWAMVMRYMLAVVFVGIFWLLIALSDALLELVGIEVLSHLFKDELLRALISGAMLGLGLAVVYELRQMLSPFLVLRLLPLLVPLVLAVVAVFIAALPIRGLSELFGGVSSAGTLRGASVASVTLVSVAVDRSDDLMVSSKAILIGTRVLAMLQLVLAVLALWAVSLRVLQYGWTPDRVLAATYGGLLLLYGLGYCVIGVLGTNWTGRLRLVNTRLALLTIAVSAFWLTPVLDANRISVNSQIKRFNAGTNKAEDLAFWSMQHEWGRAGQRGLQQLEALTDHPDRAKIIRSITTVRDNPDRYRFEQSLADQRAPEELTQLIAALPVRPEGAPLTVGELSGLPDYRRKQWLDGCARTLADGRPGCVLVFGEFQPVAARQAMILHLDEQYKTRVHHVSIDAAEVVVQEAYEPTRQKWAELPGGVIGAVQSGDFALIPKSGLALQIGDRVLEAGR